MLFLLIERNKLFVSKKQIARDEADIGWSNLGCSSDIRNKFAWCTGYKIYSPYYLFSRYPLETTKFWNLTKLLSPRSWMWTFVSIITIVLMMKIFTKVGVGLGCDTSIQDITLVPFRQNTSYIISFYII